MEKVLKFPKEKTKIVNGFLDAYYNHDFRKAVTFKDDVVSNFELLKNDKLFEKMLESYFELSAFSNLITFGNELLRLKYESFDLYYYMILSSIALVDIYRAKSIINNSRLLNHESIKFYYENDGANYSNILSLSECLFMEAAPCLLIINYINEVIKELAGNYDLDRQYLLYRFFDLINMIYELGYDGWVIIRLERALKIIFEIDL